MITLVEKTPRPDGTNSLVWKLGGINHFATLIRDGEAILHGWHKNTNNRGWEVELFGQYTGEAVTVYLKRGYWKEEE